MIDIDEYESLLYDWKIRLTKEGVEEAKAHWFHENGEGLLAEVKRLYEMMDALASFHIVKNVEQGFTQREWVELVELAKRGEEE
tara:strand:+ start:190 stop:441 length:252 start_codon:yes stop_codon:yes gene_type:complete